MNEKLKIIEDIQNVITSFVVMRELSENSIQSKYSEVGLNRFNRHFIFNKFNIAALNIKVHVIIKELYAELDEIGLGVNTSRIESLKKWRRITLVPASQGSRVIQIKLKDTNDVQQLLEDLSPWL